MIECDRQRKNQEITQKKERWRKYQNDNVGQREVIENIWVRSYQNSPRESMKNEKKKRGKKAGREKKVLMFGVRGACDL